MMHRLLRRACLLSICFVSQALHALAPAPLFASETYIEPYNVPPGATRSYEVMCPSGYLMIGVARIPEVAGATTTTVVIDSGGTVVDLSVANVAFGLVGGGARVTITNNTSSAVFGTIAVDCVPPVNPAPTAFGTQVTIPGLGSGTAAFECPGPTSVLGFVDNVDGTQERENYGVYMYDRPPRIYLDLLSDGMRAPPTGVELSAMNQMTSPRPLNLATICGNVPGLATFVYSTPTTPGNPFSIYAPIPDDYGFVGFKFVGGLYGKATQVAHWGHTGVVTSEYAAADFAIKGSFFTKGLFIEGVDTRSKSVPETKSSALAVIGVLAVPRTSAVPASVQVTVVEFYNAALDHYFITANAKEISDLDGGVHPGWARTGKSFKAYDVGSSGRTGRRPVCRAYGNPAVGLDSHFYSASPKECVETITKFGKSWLLEASEVFGIDLPDASTGACPAAGVPIYRVWNNRADSNHRYTTSIADRDAMVAKGYVKEGYGPQSVTLCALAS